MKNLVPPHRTNSRGFLQIGKSRDPFRAIGAIRPVGASRERKVNVRLLAATHRDLHAMVQQQKFREDLLYRLVVVVIEIPTLRHRRKDILPLLEHFFQTFRMKYPQSPVEGFTPAALARLMDYPWPGNVRDVDRPLPSSRQLLAGLATGLRFGTFRIIY